MVVLLYEYVWLPTFIYHKFCIYTYYIVSMNDGGAYHRDLHASTGEGARVRSVVRWSVLSERCLGN